MITDIGTVLWKEMKELLMLQQAGNKGLLRGPISLIILVGVFGIWMPWQMGQGWVESPATLLYWAWVPLFLVSSVVAQAFAGERERHTLETLLATRLSDRAILLGKVAAAMAYGWGLTLVSLLVGLVTVNILHSQGRLLLFPAQIGIGILVFSFLTSLLAASIGVLISLRAATVRQAYQTMSLAIMILLFGGIYGLRALPPEIVAPLMARLSTEATTIGLIAALILAVLNGIMLSLAMLRFQRARLILD